MPIVGTVKKVTIAASSEMWRASHSSVPRSAKRAAGSGA
jgi:hypothetical protein